MVPNSVARFSKMNEERNFPLNTYTHTVTKHFLNKERVGNTVGSTAPYGINMALVHLQPHPSTCRKVLPTRCNVQTRYFLGSHNFETRGSLSSLSF